MGVENKIRSKKSTKKSDKLGFLKAFMGLVNGNALTRNEVLQHLPYMLFLAAVALVYIVNGFWAENTVRDINTTNSELKELRSEYITTKSDLMYRSKQSEVALISQDKGMGLKESYLAPGKIVEESSNNIEQN